MLRCKICLISHKTGPLELETFAVYALSIDYMPCVAKRIRYQAINAGALDVLQQDCVLQKKNNNGFSSMALLSF